LSLIETSLEKLRRAAASKESHAPAATAVHTARVEPIPLEPRCAHRRSTIDFARLRASDYLPDKGVEQPFADYFHRIKRPLIDRALRGGAADLRLILLCSALPGDGKTFLALNLALSMARERDISVLLVDGDLPRGQISRVLGMEGESGLLEALQDSRLDVESLVFDTDVPNLEFLPRGTPAGGTAELVASARMREIATRLSRNPSRLVLFDSPPLVVSSEGRALVQLPGQIVLVARARRTPRRAILDALALLDKKKLQGFVLNDARVSAEHGYYGYPGYGESREATSKSL